MTLHNIFYILNRFLFLIFIVGTNQCIASISSYEQKNKVENRSSTQRFGQKLHFAKPLQVYLKPPQPKFCPMQYHRPIEQYELDAKSAREIVDQSPDDLNKRLKQGLSANATYKGKDDKKYPLSALVISKNMPDHLKLLLDAGADANAIDENGQPIARHAMLAHSPVCLEKLLQKGMNPNTKIRRTNGKLIPISNWASYNERPKHFQLLMDKGADPNSVSEEGEPLLHTALNVGDTEYLKILLEKKVNTKIKFKDDKGIYYSPLCWTIIKNRPQHCQLLLQAGADPNEIDSNGQPIAIHAFFADPIFLEKMLQKGLNPNTEYAAEGGHKYPLSCLAISCNEPNHLKLLLKAGADPHARSGHGNLIAIHAIKKESPLFLQIFLDNGLNPDVMNCEGDPLLNATLESESTEPLTMLIRQKINIHAKIYDSKKIGHSALFWTVAQNKPRHCEVLLQAGANPYEIDANGHSIINIARDFEHSKVFTELFEKYKKSKAEYVEKITAIK